MRLQLSLFVYSPFRCLLTLGWSVCQSCLLGDFLPFRSWTNMSPKKPMMRVRTDFWEGDATKHFLSGWRRRSTEEFLGSGTSRPRNSWASKGVEHARVVLYTGKMGSICRSFRALPASIWGHSSQVLMLIGMWGRQKGVSR